MICCILFKDIYLYYFKNHIWNTAIKKFLQSYQIICGRFQVLVYALLVYVQNQFYFNSNVGLCHRGQNTFSINKHNLE